MRQWIAERPNVEAVYVPFHEVVTEPVPHATRINALLGNILDEPAMVQAVDPSLYRNRAT